MNKKGDGKRKLTRDGKIIIREDMGDGLQICIQSVNVNKYNPPPSD